MKAADIEQMGNVQWPIWLPQFQSSKNILLCGNTIMAQGWQYSPVAVTHIHTQLFLVQLTMQLHAGMY